MDQRNLQTDYLKRLKHFRKSIGKTQTEFAEVIGTKKSTFSKMENGILGLYFEQVMKLHEAFRINPLWLWYGEGTPKI